MKQARNSSNKPYDCKKDWPEDCFVQCGDKGLVISRSSDSYTTAFFEAFPKNPSCFLRGEGANIEEAEEDCWNRYLKVKSCDHEMERRDRTDGYGYCKHCSYSSMVFEPLTRCCKCGIPSRDNVDYKGNYYCGKHKVNKLRDPNPPRFFDTNKKRTPRKRKKLLKKGALKIFEQGGIFGKVFFRTSITNSKEFRCNGKIMRIIFRAQEKKLLGIKTRDDNDYEDFDN